jgi:hypothetical protein
MGLGFLDVLGSVSGGLADSMQQNNKSALLRQSAEARRTKEEEAAFQAKLRAVQQTNDPQALADFLAGASIPESFKGATGALTQSANRQIEQKQLADADATSKGELDAFVEDYSDENVAGVEQFGVEGELDSERNQRGNVLKDLVNDASLDLPETKVTEGQLRRLGRGGAEGGAQKFANLQVVLDKQLEQRIGKSKLAEKNKIANAIGTLKDEDDAIAKRNQAKALGALDLVEQIDARIERGFGDDVENSDPVTGGVRKSFMNALPDAIKLLEGGSTGTTTEQFLLAGMGGQQMNQKERESFDTVVADTVFRKTDLTADGKKTARRAKGIVSMLHKLEVLVKDPQVRDAMGKYKGLETELERWYKGGFSGKGTRIEEFFTLSGMTVDEFSRIQSGAALTEDERKFYLDLVGGITTNPEAFMTRAGVIKDQFRNTAENIYGSALLQKYGASDRDDLLEMLLGDAMVSNDEILRRVIEEQDVKAKSIARQRGLIR